MTAQLKHAKELFPFQEIKYIYSEKNKPESVQIRIEDFLGLMETLDIISNKKLIHSIERGLAEIKKGKLLSHEEIFN